MPNSYDDRQVDVEELHRRLDADHALQSPHRVRHGLSTLVLRRLGLYERLVDAGLIRQWFDEFGTFWTQIVGGRPLRLHDFFFLQSHYRTKFQAVAVADDSDPDTFMRAWQHPSNIYTLFGTAYKYAVDPVPHRLYRRHLPKQGKILEYGCGVAPITAGLIRSGAKPSRFTVADIRNFTFLYAKWRLRKLGVGIIDLDPYQRPTLPGPYSAVLLLTVLEHLPDPISVVESLLSALSPGGVLIFDYIKSEGTGLDTAAARDQRGEVLALLESRCDLISGRIRIDQSMGTTVMRLRD